jgi:hypothetical protein
LNAIDASLMARLPNGPEGDMDARDIVRKSGYLLKVAKAHPEIVLKYIMSRCKVLTQYDLVPIELTQAAAALVTASQDDISKIGLNCFAKSNAATPNSSHRSRPPSFVTRCSPRTAKLSGS